MAFLPDERMLSVGEEDFSIRSQGFARDAEQMLLALMKAGERQGARSILNRMLGQMFASTDNLNLVRARMVELLGFLGRAAVEEDERMEAAAENNLQWMSRVVAAPDVEELTAVVRAALDDFCEQIYLLGHSRSNRYVFKALKYIGDHYRDPLAVGQISRAAGLSESRLSHLVKEVTGKTLTQHILRVRLEAAQRLLDRTDLSCTEIAYETGFGDQSYFIRKFRERVGIPPARYRRMCRRRK